MPAHSDADLALDALKASGFAVNADWERAHALAQAHEGEAVFDSLHAFCHRIEGDHGNAAYWDRRAGTDFGGNGHAAEFEALQTLLDDAK